MYIKEQTDKKSSVCNLDDLKDVAQVLTNSGWKNPSQEPVHFTCLYGNRIDLLKMFPGLSLIFFWLDFSLDMLDYNKVLMVVQC